ncbi:MAG: thiosulfate oxidation carrier complex protein SoxZ [Betaproteobacteria bacterium]|nr:thiosulfate oxidation carrier complex protein SoxZ [Betaproteobacteria bacterium]
MTARLRVPDTARPGDIVEVRLLIQHDMETGFRRDMQGRAVPMNVITEVRARYGESEVFRAELGSGVSANPYLAFPVRALKTGEIRIEWVDSAGVRGGVSAVLNVA